MVADQRSVGFCSCSARPERDQNFCPSKIACFEGCFSLQQNSMAEARVVRKAGEGYDKPNADQELPIDINYQKLAEWLVSDLIYAAPAAPQQAPLRKLAGAPADSQPPPVHVCHRLSARSCLLTGTSGCRPSRQRCPRQSKSCRPACWSRWLAVARCLLTTSELCRYGTSWQRRESAACLVDSPARQASGTK